MKWTAQNIPDLKGKVAIVTGANSGLGLETTRALARSNAVVVMACRDPKRAQSAADAIRKEIPHARLELMALDLSKLMSVRDFATRYQQTYAQLDLLVNNAGVMAIPLARTQDKFEMQFGVNHLGHFALTALLWGKLSIQPGARVVNVSSLAYRPGKIDFDDLNWEKRYSKWEAYCRSKLANVLFTQELHRRIQAKGLDVKSLVAHPGYSDTNLPNAGFGENANAFARGIFWLGSKIMAQSAEMGALPQLYAATAREAESGAMYGPRGINQLRGYPKRVSIRTNNTSPEVAAQLWAVSERLVGIPFAV